MWFSPPKTLDKFTDGITMYRLLLYYLGGLLAVAFCLSLTGNLHYNPLYIAASAAILVGTCWVVNKVFAAIFNAPINPESSLITALILALIISPDLTGYNILFMLAAAGLAMASKYILAIRKKHIFNPAAIAVVLTALGPQQDASWWIGTAWMLPFVIAGGVLIIRKIRRGRMVTAFFITATLATILFTTPGGANVGTALYDMVFSSPMFFLGFVMLTEPLTSPVTTQKQHWYAVLVGALLPPQAHLLSLYSSPELALIVGNVLAYAVSPKIKLFPVLEDKLAVANNTLDFIFTPNQAFAYQPGQYMEFTLWHPKADARGSRRYFTLASSPTEPNLRIGVKFHKSGSSFKRALLQMGAHTPIVASQVAGDFVMPKDPAQKLAFIAGGIGVTPFRSMAKYLADTNDRRSVTMLYSARTESDVVYREVFEEARQAMGMRTYYGITGDSASITNKHTFRGFVTADIIKRTIPDYQDRIFYISGTHQMVSDMRDILASLGVRGNRIKVDFFPGYA